MSRAYTAAEHAEHVRDQGAKHGLRLVSFVDAQHGSGVIFTENRAHPGVLGVAAVDSTGDSAHLALTRAEAAVLRDALTAWLVTP